jgi:hypothetical protein
MRNDLNVVQVVGWTGEVIIQGRHEPTETMDLNDAGQPVVDVREEGPPRVR